VRDNYTPGGLLLPFRVGLGEGLLCTSTSGSELVDGWFMVGGKGSRVRSRWL
jgi:hypothetical protein